MVTRTAKHIPATAAIEVQALSVIPYVIDQLVMARLPRATFAPMLALRSRDPSAT